MRVIVAGSRSFKDYALLSAKLDKILANQTDIEIVSGTAYGADKLGEKYAEEKGYKIARYPADWAKYGKSAGYKRNVEMSENADSCICFWDGESSGTKHMINIAKEKGLKLRIIKY